MRSAGSNESGDVERHPGEDRCLRQFERRPCGGAARHAAAGFRYNAIPLREAPRADASVAYVAMRSPISNTFARYQNAEKAEAQRDDQEQHDVLRPLGHDPRKQSAGDPRPARDDHKGAILDNAGCPRRQRSSGGTGEIRATYRDSGGDIQYQLFEGCEHEWVAQRGHKLITHGRW